jgi:hypothetical protein
MIFVYGILRDTLNVLPNKVLLFLDSCHSGNVWGGNQKRGGQADIDGIVNDLSAAENGVVVIRRFHRPELCWKGRKAKQITKKATASPSAK